MNEDSAQTTTRIQHCLTHKVDVPVFESPLLKLQKRHFEFPSEEGVTRNNNFIEDFEDARSLQLRKTLREGLSEKLIRRSSAGHLQCHLVHVRAPQLRTAQYRDSSRRVRQQIRQLGLFELKCFGDRSGRRNLSNSSRG